ncbi:putative nonribosomal peptide synthase [Amylostereum chailletii]|nr:putative nonribosomal peptide synthase [Amylostereum chailletii]
MTAHFVSAVQFGINSGVDDLFVEPIIDPKEDIQTSLFDTIDTTLPLSSTQKSLLAKRGEVITQWTNKKIVFSGTKGDLVWIHATWDAVAAHNTILRSAIMPDPATGQFLQAVAQFSRPLEVLDIASEVTAPEFSPQLSELIPRANLQHDPKNKVYILTLWYPRILLDDHSFSLIEDDLFCFYRGKSFAERPSLRSYLSFTAEHYKGDQALAFWRATYKGAATPKLPLIPDATEDVQDAREVLLLESSTKVVPGLVHLEKVEGLPRTAILDAAWAVILARHCAGDSVMFAAADRDSAYPDAKKVIGYLDQLFPLRAEVDEHQTVVQLAKALQASKRAASLHAHLSYDEIMEQLPADSKVQTFLRYVEDLERPTCLTHGRRFPLEVCIKANGVLKASVGFAANLAEKDVRVMVEHFFVLLEHVVADPSTTIGALNCMSKDEVKFVLDQAKPAKAPQPALVHQMFEERVRMSPSAIAVEFDQGPSLTFDGLNKLANTIAHTLPRDQPSIIPVCMDVSIELVASLLAIMKSGNAYVTLDPENPVERNAFIVEDVSAPVVLCHAAYANRFGDKAQVVTPFASAKDVPATGPDNLNIDIPTDHRAYLVYTSGSTGKPKGVVLDHAAATCGIASFTGSTDLRSLLFYNPIFSAAQRTILATMIHGGVLCLANRKTMSASLGRIIKDMHVNSVGLTSSTASLLNPDDVPNLKQVTLTGELIDPNVVNTWAAKVQVRTAYGLSECTQINMGRQLFAGSNPRIVGRPCDTTSAYVLVPGTTALAPLLVQGELCLGGHQLGREYLNRPDLTAAAFVPNPFGPGRLYRTGDRAVCHADGSIEIVGRIDHQIKINGQRVEPAEVAAVLQTHADITAATVIGATIAERKCLVACVVFDPSSTDSVAVLVDHARKHVAKHLPVYMLPSYYLPMEKIPRNANGKVDVPTARRAAEELGRDGLLALLAVIEEGEEESSPHMSVLRRVVAEALSIPVDTVTTAQSFLALGGSSLEAIRISMALLKEGLSVQAGDIIRAESFASLLQSVETTTHVGDPAAFELLKEVPTAVKSLQNAVDAFPVTAMQEGVLASLLQNDTRYIYQRPWDARHLDVSRVKEAVRVVFKERPILRTTFIEHGESFIQVVRDTDVLPWEEHDMSVAEYKAFDHKRSMQFGGVFFRVALLRGEVLVVSMHHSLFDYWSHKFFYEDVAAAYSGVPVVPRPPFSRFVADVIRNNAGVDEKFWTEYLENVHPTVLGSVTDMHSVARDIKLDLRLAASDHGITAGAAIYTAWALVLSRHINSEDIVFATTLSGRDRAVVDVQTLDGPTLTTVPQRVKLSSTSTFLELVTSVQDGLWNMSKHAQYGMRGALRAAHHGSGKLFDTLVNLLTPDAQDANVNAVFIPYGTKSVWSSEFQTLEIQELATRDGFHVSLNSGLEPHRAEFILDQFAIALEAISTNPTAVIQDVRFTSQREIDFLHNLCPQTVFPAPAFLHAQFESIAQTTPDRLAIQWLDEEFVSYGELDKRANRIAHYLKQFIAPGDIVALLMDKSSTMIATLLAVMKAGGAYVPLSPDNPSDRNNFIIEDVRSKLLLTEVHHGFEITGSARAVFVDELDTSSFPDTAPVIVEHATSHPAYVIYTSGSTGLPKGVVMPHAPAAAAVWSMLAAEKRFQGEWRTLQFANYVFDASVEDIFNTLSSGGCLCMAPTAMMLSDLASVMTQMRVRQAILTPTVARLMKPEQVPTLSRLILGGEPMTSDLIAEWTKSTTLLNVYGPTETAMVISAKELSPGVDSKNIGRPFPTASAYILRADNTELVPYGAVGELCFGGSQLSAGYHNRTDLTDKAYIDFHGQRIYRTGDLARWLPSGEIECLGRKDNQVKINGHRVELPEIENAIIKTGRVIESTVVVANFNGKPQLVALCVFESSSQEGFLDPDLFRAAVMAVKDSLTSLTPYMIPKFWIPMGSFPKLPSRKTDRKTLLAMVQKLESSDLAKFAPGSASQEAVVPIETPEEEILQRLWAGQFDLEPQALGRNSNFMSLGADSISAIKLVGQCRREGYKLEVSQVLDNLVLSAMASCMRKMESDSGAQVQFIANESAYALMEERGLSRDAIANVIPSPPGQAEFLRQGRRDTQFWNLMTVRPLPAEVDLDQWLKVTEELTRRNGILRSTFIETPEHGWLQVELKDTALSWEVVDTTVGDKQAVVDEAWSERFEFGKPFIFYKLLRFPDGSRELLMKLDHALYDGQLLRVFDAQFQAISRGEEPFAAATSFEDLALSVWSTPKAPALAFWTELLSGCAFVYPQVQTPKITAAKSKPANMSLDVLAKTYSVTVPIIFQTAFQLWMAKKTGKSDILFDLLVAGRNVNGLEDADRINGTCANFLPFRSRFEGVDALGEYMKATQSLFWKTGENAVVGLDEIYGALGVERGPRTSRALFLYQPFEPAKGGPVNHNRWLVMALSQVRMFQPYAIVTEVFKTRDGHMLRVYYDAEAISEQEAESFVEEIWEVLDGMVNAPGATVADLLV